MGRDHAQARVLLLSVTTGQGTARICGLMNAT